MTQPNPRFELYRNVRSRDLLELFFVSAVSSLLAVRFYLYVTGYPQIGGGGLHIAHMLWGGALMLVAMTISLSFLGRKTQTLTALIGGVGFGIFIDELGKFITKDNDYFFEPTIGILYAMFVVIYLAFNFLSRRQRLSSREYQLNALAQLEDAVAFDMSKEEKARVRALLKQADQDNVITRQLKILLNEVKTVPSEQPNIFGRTRHWIDEHYRRFWRARRTNGLVRIFFVLEIALFLAGIVFASYDSFDNVAEIFFGKTSYSTILVVGELISALVAAGYVMYGLYRLKDSRVEAFEQFRRATLVNLFLTEFFVFSREQFGALPGFVFNLALLIIISFVLHQERRLDGND